MLCFYEQMIPVLMTELCDNSLEETTDVMQINRNNSLPIKLICTLKFELPYWRIHLHKNIFLLIFFNPLTQNHALLVNHKKKWLNKFGPQDFISQRLVKRYNFMFMQWPYS